MKHMVSLILLLLSTGSMAADYQQEIDKFFDLYKAGKTDAAVDSIYKTNQFVSAIPDQIKSVKTQLASLSGLVGSINHIGKVSDYLVGDAIIHITYLVTYDRQPVRFEFQFFKVKEGWRIYMFSFDDGLDDEIKALARQDALKVKK